MHATTLEQPTLTRETTTTQEAPAPKKRGRPPGARNKPKVIEEPPPEPVLLEPDVEEQEEEYEEPPPKKIKKPRAPKAKAQPTYAPPPTPQSQPQVSTPLQVAASMLEILRLGQVERQHRKSQLYKSWVK